ncbi:MAG: hypothetical protein ACLTV6_04155 [Christensenellales bacterium]
MEQAAARLEMENAAAQAQPILTGAEWIRRRAGQKHQAKSAHPAL